MLHPEDFVCPICGAIFSSWHAFHQHVAKQHEQKKEASVLTPTNKS